MTAPALQPGDPATDIHALAMWLEVPVTKLKHWARADKWPRKHTTTHRGRRTLYSMDAARTSYIKHAAANQERRVAGQSPEHVI